MYLDFDSTINPAFNCLSNHWFSAFSSFNIIVYVFAFNSLRASSIRFILWSHSHYSSSFLNFFLLNKWVNSWIYFSKSSGFIVSSSFLIFLLSYFLVSVACVLLVLNLISWCFILQLPEYLVNHIVSFFQFTSGLCLTNQSCPRNISVPFKSITAASNYFLCLLISISKGAILVTSLFFVLSTLNTLNEKFIGFICILFSLTSCLLMPMCMHPKSTNILTLRFLPFFVFTFAYTFNSLSTLLHQFGITYFFENFQMRSLVLCLLKIFSKTLFLIFLFVIFIIWFFLNLSFLH